MVVSDAWADADEVRHEYGISLGVIDEANPVDALVVAVAHEEYRTLEPSQLRRFCRSNAPVLADLKSVFSRYDATQAGFTVFRF